MKIRGRLLSCVLLSILGASLSGCGSGAPTVSTPSAQPAATTQAASTSGPSRTLSAVLNSQNGGTVQATLTVTVRAAGYLLHLEGRSLHPGGRYPVRTIGGGPCGSPFLPPIHELGNLVGDESGNGLVEKSYPSAYLSGGIIAIGDYLAQSGEFERRLIACAELPAG